jgi:hypothetical protein
MFQFETYFLEFYCNYFIDMKSWFSVEIITKMEIFV